MAGPANPCGKCDATFPTTAELKHHKCQTAGKATRRPNRKATTGKLPDRHAPFMYAGLCEVAACGHLAVYHRAGGCNYHTGTGEAAKPCACTGFSKPSHGGKASGAEFSDGSTLADDTGVEPDDETVGKASAPARPGGWLAGLTPEERTWSCRPEDPKACRWPNCPACQRHGLVPKPSTEGKSERTLRDGGVEEATHLLRGVRSSLRDTSAEAERRNDAPLASYLRYLEENLLQASLALGDYPVQGKACDGACATCTCSGKDEGKMPGNRSTSCPGCQCPATAHDGDGCQECDCSTPIMRIPGGKRDVIGEGEHGATYAKRNQRGEFSDIQRQDRTARAEAIQHRDHGQAKTIVKPGYGYAGDTRGKEESKPVRLQADAQCVQCGNDVSIGYRTPAGFQCQACRGGAGKAEKCPTCKGRGTAFMTEGQEKPSPCWNCGGTGHASDASTRKGKADPVPIDGDAVDKLLHPDRHQPARANFGKASDFDPDSFLLAENYEDKGFHAIFATRKGGKADAEPEVHALIFPNDRFTDAQAKAAANEFAEHYDLQAPTLMA